LVPSKYTLEQNIERIESMKKEGNEVNEESSFIEGWAILE
jgi:hypothetical protein